VLPLHAPWQTIRPILVADEPTGNLDLYTSDEIMDLLRYGGARQTPLIVTHDWAWLLRATRQVNIKPTD
jgi:ABC-type lipoprotein export system ATPase subunit